MRQWYKMTSRGTKKKGKLAEYFGSKSHKAEKDKKANKDDVFILLGVARTQGYFPTSNSGLNGRQDEEDGNFNQSLLDLI